MFNEGVFFMVMNSGVFSRVLVPGVCHPGARPVRSYRVKACSRDLAGTFSIIKIPVAVRFTGQ